MGMKTVWTHVELRYLLNLKTLFKKLKYRSANTKWLDTLCFDLVVWNSCVFQEYMYLDYVFVLVFVFVLAHKCIQHSSSSKPVSCRKFWLHIVFNLLNIARIDWYNPVLISMLVRPDPTRSCHPFYILVEFLAKEARFVVTQTRLIRDRKLKKTQKKRTRDMLGKINEKWVKYSEGGMQTNIISYFYPCRVVALCSISLFCLLREVTA